MKMRSIFGRVFVFSACALMAAISVAGQSVGAGRAGNNSGSYTVTGKVLLPDGKPAVGARVDVSCDFTTASARTDPDGTYRITGIPAGNCSIVARVSGFDPVTEYRQITRDTPYGQAVYIPIFIRPNPNVATDPSIPKQAVEKFNSAMEKNEKGNADAAIQLFEEAIAAYPAFAAAWYQKGMVLLKKNDVDKAIEAFVRAIELKPDSFEAKYAFGLAHLQKKNYEVAEAVFRDVLKQNNGLAEAHLNLGISLFHLKNSDAAEAELKAAVATKGGEKLALGHLYLGQIYMQKKRNTDAIAELQKYVDLLPKAPNAERIKSVIADLKKQS